MVARAGVVMELAEWEAETVVVTVVGVRVVAAVVGVTVAVAVVEEAESEWVADLDLQLAPPAVATGLETVVV